MARAQSGDLDAFEDLVNRHTRRVYRALVGVVGSFDEAQDAMQETFLKAFQHIGSFQGRSKILDVAVDDRQQHRPATPA